MRSRLWMLACLLCLAGVWFFWQQENGRDGSPSRPHQAVAPSAFAPLRRDKAGQPYLVSSVATNIVAGTNKFAYRLSNTSKTIGQLVGDRHAILLENALIDTASPLNFSIPTHLRSQGDPGAYIIQAHGPIDNAFRAMLASAGAEIVSYIPNDAYLVRAPAGVANGLAANPLTQAVISYEPYYKISSSMPVTVGQKTVSSAPMGTNRAAGPSLLELAVKQSPLPAGTCLTLGLFNNGAAATVAQIEKLGGQIIARDNSPFGPVVRVQPPQNWTVLATLPGVQLVEPYHQRVHANDLSRATVGVASDTLVPTNYMGLTGKGVMVAVADTGIDATHHDFSVNGPRIFGALLTDTSGHGTHVAGIIAGDGTESMTVTNASGSIIATMPGPTATNFQFRGKAPAATLLSMNLNLSSDQELQEAAALTNALISNNSWNHDGDTAYDLAAASYDAAVRDALPGVTGSQPVLFVFSAGNSGGGNNGGGGGNPDTILSPATAKNVITVGALEQLRKITNQVTDLNSNQSEYWYPKTDTSFQVAGYSSLGNVGVGIEGDNGRFKPDVVAPGSFVISTRSSQWDEHAYYDPTNYNVTVLADHVNSGSENFYSLLVPANVVQIVIELFANISSPSPFPNLPIYLWKGTDPRISPPDLIGTDSISIPPDSTLNPIGAGWSYAVSNNTSGGVGYDLFVDIVTTNDNGNQFQVLSNLNNSLDGSPDSMVPPHYYRYESGTSMAAADVSGVLALMQEFFTNPSFGIGLTPSPALLKGMLINGARLGVNYSYEVQNPINFQGWGLINLPDSLPPGMTNQLNAACASFFVDQSPTNALATGDSHTYSVNIPDGSDGQLLPLRVTLTWTDPPGNPAAAIKLVNSLELVVTNFDDPANPVIYYGNDIAGGNTYNTPEGTNAPNYDSINNIQNVFIPALLGVNYSVTVIGRRVNVNAVTAHTNNVVQDYALVISCGEGEVADAFTVTDNPIVSNPTTDQQITFVGAVNAPLLNQFAGASTPLLGTSTILLTTNGTELNGIQLGGTNIVTLGMVNQWHFYVMTNPGPADFTNAAFITFIPDTLSIPRMGVFQDSVDNATRPEADIDLYVSSNPGLMNLDPVVISGADKSVGRGGIEFVYYTNSAPGKVYYVGVYSEDREASEYGLIPIFSNIPFSQMNSNGDQIVNGQLLPVNIPDGSPAHPGIGYVFALAINPMEIKRVVMTNIITHQNFGDLIGPLAHSQQTGLSQGNVLNNHDSLGNTFGPPPRTFIYDDSGQNNIFGSQTSDGPGSLNSYVGKQGIGPWILTEVDDSPTQIGSVTGFSLLIERHQDLDKGIGINGTVYGGSWFYDYIDVPAGATSLTISATNLTLPPLPLQLFVRLGAVPTLTNYDAMVMLTGTPPPSPGGTIYIPSPAPGRYWIGIWNPNLVAQNFHLIATIDSGTPPGQVIFSSSGPAPILDDAVITNSIFVTRDEAVSSVEAALRVDHPRVSDLVFHLTSPAGTRVLLVENRGGTTTEGMGATLAITNNAPATASGDGSPSTSVIDTGQTAGTVQISYDFYTVPDEMVVYYQGTPVFDSGIVSGSGVFNVPYGPGTDTQLTIVMNPTVNPGQGDLWDYTINSPQAKNTYLVLTEDTTKTTTPIKFAPVPFHGFLTNLVTTNTVHLTNWVPVTNAAVGWYSSFEGNIPAIGATLFAGSYFPEGWIVNSGSVDILPAVALGSTAFEGTNYIDINGNGSGTISTNVPTVAGQIYLLSFAYAQNPNRRATEAVQLQANSSPLLTLTINNPTNTWADLGWATTSFLFAATSPSTTFTFASQTPSASGVLLDAIGLAPLTGANGFEGAVAGDYAQSHYFDGWFVNNNQVTVITDTNLAYRGSNLLALADGQISRILPTIPGSNYMLSFAYRGPGIVSLWRGENNTLDNIGNNDGSSIGSMSYANGEVNKAFNLTGSEYVEVSDSSSLRPASVTLECWINVSDIDLNIMISKAYGDASQDSYNIWYDTGELRAGINSSDSSPPVLSYIWSPVYGTWHHIAYTFVDGTGKEALYLDGVAVASGTASGPILYDNHPVLIGADADSGNVFGQFIGLIDEASIYSRGLSASEIQAIYKKGTAGKYDLAAPSFAQGLAEAQLTLGGTNLLFFGNNTNWQTTNIIFTATQSNTVLQVAGLEPGMLLDNFALSYAVVTITNVVTTNLNGGDVFYLPEQSLDTFAGESALGQWQLEIWDNRAGAGLSNTLVSWQLRFNFATNLNSIGVLTNGLAVTNVIPPGGMAYYLVEVPPNADWATNILFSTNGLPLTGPLNVWFNSTNLPAGTNPPDYLLIPSSTGGRSILGLNTNPTNIVPGGTYYLGVQNTNGFPVTYGIKVDFHLLFPPVPPHIVTQVVDELTLMTVTNTATSGIPTYTYLLLNPPAGVAESANGIITWTPSEAQGPGFYTIQTIITDSSVPPLHTTNSFNVIVVEVNLAPFFTNNPPDQTIDAYYTLVVTNNAVGDPDIPANPLTYSLLNPPDGMTIDPNTGVITWTPTFEQRLTTNVIATVVTDFNGWAPVNQHLSATNYFTVRVTGFIPPPFAFTQPATSVTGTSAQLNGMATPNGPPTTAWYEWGTTTGYGNQTPPVSAGGGLNVVYVPSQINGLVMNQPYHFRLVVSNFVGVVYGFDQIFDETGVVAWGADYLGQTNVPAGLSNVVAVAAAYDHSLALKNDGTVVAWGDDTENQTNVPAGLNGVVAVAGGEFYSLALKNDGTVMAWGANMIPGQTNVPAGLNGVVNIAGGGWSSLALKSNGRVVAWGYNIAGLTNVPAGLSNAVAVAGGGYHSLAVKNNGTVVAWGDDAAGQTDVPAGLSNVVAIAGGSFHSLALKSNGRVVAWGNDDNGQTDVPPGLSNVVAIAAGGYHSLVLKNDGSVLAWGNNSSNQTTIPIGLSNVVAISSGYFYNLVLASPFNFNITNTLPVWLITSLPPQTLNELTTLLVTNTANDSDLPPQTLTYTVTMLVDTNVMIANGWPLNYATTNPSPVVNNNGVITWTPGEAQGPGVYIITAVVTDNGVPPLSATNSFIVTVNETNLPPVLNLPPDTNIVEFVAFTAQATATDPDLPPNPLTFALVNGPAGLTVTTNGVITWTPTNIGTSVVTISVTDTNAYALTNRSLSVTNQFNITVTAPPGIAINSITHTNIGGTNGFLLQWQGPTNFQYEIQWTTNLLPPIVWHTVLNPVINVVVTSTNGHYSFFDDGTLTGGFGRLKFYRVLGGLNLGPITNSGPATNTVLAGAMSQAVVTVPANAISASNFLISATGPLNVWFNQTNPPTGNVSAGDIQLLSAANAGSFVLTSNSVPPLVPGTNYYLGFQNPGTSNVTFVFQVAFGFAPTNAVFNFSVTATNGGVWLKWNGLTNYQYQVQWRTNLAPPAVWNTISNIVLTSTTGVFTFFDDGSLTGGLGRMKFYRLIAWPFMTPIPQTLSISSVTVTNIAGTNDLMLKWSAPTNYQYGIQWTTNLTLPFSNWFIITNPPPTLANGVYTFIDNGLTGPPARAKFFRIFDYP